MTYSCSDFTDDILNEFTRVGAITAEELSNADLDDNPSEQANLVLAALARLVETREALAAYKLAVDGFLASAGLTLEQFADADERVTKALAAFKPENAGTPA